MFISLETVPLYPTLGYAPQLSFTAEEIAHPFIRLNICLPLTLKALRQEK